MKKKRCKRRRRYCYFSIYSFKHDIKALLHRVPKKIFYIFCAVSFVVFLCYFNIFSILCSIFAKNEDIEQVFYANETLVENAKDNAKENENTSNSGNELLTIFDFKENDLISTENVEYQSDEYYNIENHFDRKTDLSMLKNMEYVKNNLYIVDKQTDLRADFYNIDELLSTNLKLADTKGPKVLIFNTHASEVYKDSKGKEEGVYGLSYELKKVLEEKYGIKAIVHDGVYDMVDGKTQILGAYQRMSPEVEKVLADNPSIEVCIDIHRDGLPEDIRLVSDVNGKKTAQIMFVNGLSRVFDKNGDLVQPPDIPNKNLATNLAFSLDLKLNANEMYPNFSRKIYLHAYRYSLYMKPKSILVEVGSQTNTWQEAKNAIEPLADILAETLLPSKSK